MCGLYLRRALQHTRSSYNTVSHQFPQCFKISEKMQDWAHPDLVIYLGALQIQQSQLLSRNWHNQLIILLFRYSLYPLSLYLKFFLPLMTIRKVCKVLSNDFLHIFIRLVPVPICIFQPLNIIGPYSI